VPRFYVPQCILDLPLHGIALSFLPLLRRRVFVLDTQYLGTCMLRPLPSERRSYVAAAAASLPPTATNNVTLPTSGRSSSSVVSSAQHYSTSQLN